MGFTQAPALPYSKLGIVEDGDTASQAIEKDKYVIWKGKNYFAKTDILQGETFVVDTNLEPISDGVVNGIVSLLNSNIKLFPDLSNILVNSSTIANNLNYTATEDCYISFWVASSSGARIVSLNNVDIAASSETNVSGGVLYSVSMSLYLKKGDVIRSSNTIRYIIMGLKN